MKFPAKLELTGKVDFNPASLLSIRSTNPKVFLSLATGTHSPSPGGGLEPFGEMVQGIRRSRRPAGPNEGARVSPRRGEGERLNKYFPPAPDYPLCHQHELILTQPPNANRPERGVHAASAYKGTLASRIATTVHTLKRPDGLVVTHNFSFPVKGRLIMQNSQPTVRGSLGCSRLPDKLVKRSPSPVSSPPGEDFPQTHFLTARPPVRPIQRLDLRNRLQPFPPLLGGEGRGEGERLNKIFPASDRPHHNILS